MKISCPRLALFALAALSFFSLSPSSLPASSEVTVIPNLTYAGPVGAEWKHQLDLYLPAGPLFAPAPVVFFVHGGGWITGDRQLGAGCYANVGQAMARAGFVTVVPSYRLAAWPWSARHPDQVLDVLAALSWTYRNVARYGGDPRRMVAAGHSAGVQLVSLSTLDRRYFAAAGLPPDLVKGIISVSGIFDLAQLATEGSAVEKIFNHDLLLTPAFGAEVSAYPAASPITYVRPGIPPYILINGDQWTDHLLREQTAKFLPRLQSCRVPVRTFLARGEGHFSVIYHVNAPGNPTTRQMIDFVSGLF